MSIRMRTFGSRTALFAGWAVGLVLAASTMMGAELVSVNSAGTDSGNSQSGGIAPAISANGQFVVFESLASDLVTTDTNGTNDIFVRDLQAGTTTLVSVNNAGTDSGNSLSNTQFPVISADGRFVAFVSAASDLVATDTNGTNDTFVRDLQAGTTTLVSVNSAGTDSGTGFSFSPVISADGRFVAFRSTASDIVATDTNGTTDIFVRDLQTETTTLVSVNSAGTDSGTGSSGSRSPRISADGRFVAFVSAASDLVATDTNGTNDTFVRDLQAGTTTLISINSAGTDSGNNGSVYMDRFFGSYQLISADGRFVAFRSLASDLVATDTNGTTDIFVRDLQTGTTTLVSVNSAGTDSGNSSSQSSVISADGRFVAFVSSASDLVATDTNGTDDTFLRDLQTGTTTLISVNSTGTDSGNGFGGLLASAISADGRFVAFVGTASDLVATDTNGAADTLLRDVQAGTTTLVSVNSAGTDSGNGFASFPAISADGRFVTFRSAASDLVTTDTNGTDDVFVFENVIVETFSCVGFEPPMDDPPVRVRKKRTLPLKAQLFDAEGRLVTGTNISAAPVVQVIYSPAAGDPIDVTGEALAVGLGTEGNQFEFTGADKWQYNLKTSNYSAVGTYAISIVPGDEYRIEPACVTSFVIE